MVASYYLGFAVGPCHTCLHYVVGFVVDMSWWDSWPSVGFGLYIVACCKLVVVLSCIVKDKVESVAVAVVAVAV